MRISKVTIVKPNGETESTIEIDTEAAPYALPWTVTGGPTMEGEILLKEPRLPTHQEYMIIRDLLELPEGSRELTEEQMEWVRTQPVSSTTGGITSPRAKGRYNGNSESTPREDSDSAVPPEPKPKD
jgi:hypothetical protein